MVAPTFAHADDAGESRHSRASIAGPWVFADRYEIRGLLGAGAMGSVYKAFDRELEELIALKLIRRDLLENAELVARFRQEVKLARRVTHRNVARVYDLGNAEGMRYLTMELVTGRSLASHLAAGPLPLGEAVRVAHELAAGLAAAHLAHVIHRDLKPDNVMLAEDGRVLITDFGIARTLLGPSLVSTSSGAFLGTPVYMAPEAISSERPADERSDVYSFGVMLFELLTGELPWRGANDFAVTAARLVEPARDPRELRPELPAELAAVIQRCLCRVAEDRFANAGLLEQALARVDPLAYDDLATEPTVESEARPEPPSPVVASTLADVAPPVIVSPAFPPPAALGAARGEVKTVAVLTPEGDVPAHVASGLQEAIIQALSAAPRLRVRSRGMVEGRFDPALSPAELARRLDALVLVRSVVTPTERGFEIRVRAACPEGDVRLLDAAYMFGLPSMYDLAELVASDLGAALEADRGAPRDANAPDPRVTELYLRARRAYHTFWQEGAAEAVQLLEEALRLAPADPRLLSAYALASVRRSFFTGEGIADARRAALAANAVAPDDPEVQVALASLRMQRAEPTEAVGHLRAALAAAPSYAEASWLLGRILLEADAVPAAVQRLEWALTLEPREHLARLDLARGLALLGRWDEVHRLSLESPPGHEAGNWLERARFALWRRDLATAESALAVVPSHETGPIALARELFEVLARHEPPFDKPAFAAFLAGSQRTPRREAFAAQIEAEVRLLLGEEARALAAIERALGLGLTDLSWLTRCPLLEPLRDRPSFVAGQAALAARARALLVGIDGG